MKNCCPFENDKPFSMCTCPKDFDELVQQRKSAEEVTNELAKNKNPKRYLGRYGLTLEEKSYRDSFERKGNL
jgi:hypothetical protein